MNKNHNLESREFQDYIEQETLMNLWQNCQGVFEVDYKKVSVSSMQSIRDFAYEEGYGFSAINDDYMYRCQLSKPNAFIKFEVHDLVATVYMFGEREEVTRVKGAISASFPEVGPMIHWKVSDQHTIDVPLRAKPLVQSAYPFIDGSVEDYIHEFLTSDASILVLIGPPGTGKTSLIRHILMASGKDAYLTYDKRMLEKDYFFGSWLNSSSKFLVLEDADNFLIERKEGNDMMFRFLNLGDGLVSSSDRKIIFSTNLPSISDIDAALIRPGRCFDVLEHRSLDQDEAKKVKDELNLDIDLSTQKTWTLAEMTGRMVSKRAPKKKVGFY